MDDERTTTPQSVKHSPTTPIDSDKAPHLETGKEEASSDDSSDEDKALSDTKSPFAVFLVISGILSCLFLVGLDRTIVSTAIPEITNEFHSLGDFGWYGSAYLLTCCALQLLFGKLFTFFSVRYTLFLSVLTFEVASAVCGSARSSVTFIIGRAICGIGAAGIFAGAMSSMIHVVPLRHRPKVFGIMGAAMALAQIGGPLIGGGFTTGVSWRWCFYINLPIGALAMVAVALFLDIPQQDIAKQPLMAKLAKLDFPGTILVAAGTICILIALQWGGQTYAWSNGRIIALLTVGLLCMIAFAAVQVMMPETATLPLYLLKNRTVVAAFFLFIFFSCSNFIFIYYIPAYFQAIHGVSAAQSGIRTIPMMAATIIGTLIGGFGTSKVGYYTPFAIAGACIGSIGAGLLCDLQVGTSQGKWISYQIIYGIGLGLIYQVPNLAIQAVLPKKDAPTGFALALFGGLLLSSVFLSVGENVLATQLVDKFSELTGTDVDAATVYGSGATTLLAHLPEDKRNAGLVAYNASLRVVFEIGLAMTCLCVPAAAALEMKSIRGTDADKFGQKEKKDAGAAEKGEEDDVPPTVSM